MQKLIFTRIIFYSYLIFLWGMPFWAWFFNDYLQSSNFSIMSEDANSVAEGKGAAKQHSYKGYVCNVAPENMHCTQWWMEAKGYTSFADVAKERVKYSGGRTNVGCGCGQGVFGENLCPQDKWGFTLSSFISSAPAAGAFGSMTGFLLISQWDVMKYVNDVYEVGNCAKAVSYVTLGLFMVSFVVFTFSTDCIFMVAHGVTTMLFLGGMGAHLLTVCIAIFRSPRKDKHAVTVASLMMAAVVLAFALVLATQWDVRGIFTWLVGVLGPDKGIFIFFYAEIFCISVVVGLGPFLEIWGSYQTLDSTPRSQQFMLVDAA